MKRALVFLTCLAAGCIEPIHHQRAAWYSKGHAEELKREISVGLARARPGTAEAKRWELMSFHVEPVIEWQSAELRHVGAPPDVPDVARGPEDTKAWRVERDRIEEMNGAVEEAKARGGLLGLALGLLGSAGGGGILAVGLRLFTKYRGQIQQLTESLTLKDRALDQADSMVEEGIPPAKRRKLGASRPDFSAEHEARKPGTPAAG